MAGPPQTPSGTKKKSDKRANQIICQTGLPMRLYLPAPLYWATKTSDIAVTMPKPPTMAQANVPALTDALSASREYLARKMRSVKIINREAKVEIIKGKEIRQSSRILPSG